MITCSHCQFENPPEHRFCQRCGSPLKVWRALLLSDPMQRTLTRTEPSLVTALSENLSLDGLEGLSSDWVKTDSGADPETGLPWKLPQGAYLDSNQRYQLLEDLIFTPGEASEGIVLDTQSEQPSSLQASNPNLQIAFGLPQDAGQLSQLPLAAAAYLQLQKRFFPSIPELQDAWVTPSYGCLLIEDRTAFSRLLDVWTQAELEPLQQVHCFYTMTELWEALLPLNGQTSLLRLDNLCIDEDQIFCLRQIDCSVTETSHTLQDLGLLWQSLLQFTQNTPQLLIGLAGEVARGAIATVDHLKEQLVTIADQLEALEKPLPSLPPLIENIVEAPSPIPELLVESPAFDPLPMDPLETDEEVSLGESTEIPTMVLPMKLISLEEGGQTHVGQQRHQNEDAYFIQSSLKKVEGLQGQKLEAQSLYIICDGMGGHAGGEIASRMAVESLKAYFDQHWQTDLPTEAELQTAIALANQAIYELNQQEDRSGHARMGTTLVMVLIKDTQGVVAHVGDSRLYRFTRRTGLQQVTIDHEVGQREIQRGIAPAIAYARPDAYQLTQALGPREQHELLPTITYFSLTEDTLLILCSDGLSDHDLMETHARTHVEPMLRDSKNIEEGVTNLIELANEINGHDNITVIAVKLKVKPNLEIIQMGA